MNYQKAISGRNSSLAKSVFFALQDNRITRQ